MKRKTLFVAAFVVATVGTAAWHGTRTKTSIKPEIQSIIKSHIDKAVVKYQAQNAVGILMNTKTGEIVSMYAIPNNDVILNNKFEFGGILSVLNPILALENGIDINREYNVSQNQTMTISDIVINSSNAGNTKIASDLPKFAYRDMFARLHMNTELNLDFGKTTTPTFPTEWSDLERKSASLGHGIHITPIHLMAAMNATVNDGIYVLPTLSRTQSGESVFAPKHSATVRDIMHKIAGAVWNTDMNIGIKTATASQTGTKDIVTTVFAAFPIDNPKYSLLVILNNPQKQYRMAAWNAVPLTKQILTDIMPKL